MLFESVLKSKPHNSHNLNRYIKFIKNCIEHNTKNNITTYVERHHICPKSKDLFPQYKSFVKHPWNLAVLTYRQHAIAHILLWKSYNSLSQALSVLLLYKDVTNRAGEIKVFKTKIIEKVKKDVSNKRRGVFTRGYDKFGNANVSQKTRDKISKLKTKLYSSPENRLKHSIACTGSKRLNTEKMSQYAKNRTQEHLKKISEGVSKYMNSKTNLERKKIKYGIYVTPFGIFSSITENGKNICYVKYCQNPDKKFNYNSFKHKKKNIYINNSIFNKTPRELGFFFIKKTDPQFSKYCENLNLAHLPEPNHPLSLELNDFLLRENIPLL